MGVHALPKTRLRFLVRSSGRLWVPAPSGAALVAACAAALLLRLSSAGSLPYASPLGTRGGAAVLPRGRHVAGCFTVRPQPSGTGARRPATRRQPIVPAGTSGLHVALTRRGAPYGTRHLPRSSAGALGCGSFTMLLSVFARSRRARSSTASANSELYHLSRADRHTPRPLTPKAIFITTATTSECRLALSAGAGPSATFRGTLYHLSSANRHTSGALTLRVFVSTLATSPHRRLAVPHSAGSGVWMPMHSMVWLEGGVRREPVTGINFNVHAFEGLSRTFFLLRAGGAGHSGLGGQFPLERNVSRVGPHIAHPGGDNSLSSNVALLRAQWPVAAGAPNGPSGLCRTPVSGVTARGLPIRP